MRRARSTARYCPQQEDIALELNRSRNCCCHQWGKKEGCSINVLLIEIKPKLNQKLKSINVQYTKLYKIMFNIQNYTMFLVSVCPGSLN